MAAPIRRAWLVIASAALTLSACQDSSTSTAPASPAPTLQPGNIRYSIGTTPIATIVVDPTVTNVFTSYDGSRIVIPANAICQPGTSGYGPGTWDLPCTAARQPIVFSLSSSTSSDGRTRLFIQPDVRFSPSKMVTMSLRDTQGASQSSSYIAYCATLSGTCVDESRTDGSLATDHNAVDGSVQRRVKHFSGYSVVFGLDGDSPDGM